MFCPALVWSLSGLVRSVQLCKGCVKDMKGDEVFLQHCVCAVDHLHLEISLQFPLDTWEEMLRLCKFFPVSKQ